MKFIFPTIVSTALLLIFTSCSPPPTTSEPEPAEPLATPQITPEQTPLISSAPRTANVVPTPHPAAGATQAAMQAYPDLAKKDSMFNRAFRDLFEDRKKNDPASLAKPNWPLDLAQETSKMLAIASTPIPTPGTIAAAKPKWIEDRMGKPSALDMPAYDQRRAIYPRSYYYYTDSSGQRFYIDRYGVRHNY